MATVRTFIDRYAGEQPDKVFLIAPETGAQLTFTELQRQADLIGDRLDDLDVSAGGKVAYLLHNGFWTTLLFLGVMHAGRVIVPLNAVAGIEQLSYVLEHSDAEVLFISRAFRDKLATVLRDFPRRLRVIVSDEDNGPEWPEEKRSRPGRDSLVPGERDNALLLYTSGTTGRPKGALLSHKSVIAGGNNVTGGHRLASDDRALCVLPVYHINGAMVTVMAPLVSGGSVIMPHRFSAQQFWRWAAEHRCTWSSMVPTIIKYLLDRAGQEPFSFGEDPRLRSFRFARSASAALPATVFEAFERTFKIPMIETLGLTETAGTVLTNPMPPLVHKPASVGLPFGNDAKVIDAEGGETEPGQIGEIVIRGDNVLDHYYKNEAATRIAFAEGGWFRTGDLGYRDDDGYFFLTGRLKELIIKGGENIAPREIDDVLYRHEAVLEAAAVGVPDDNYGQEVVACVVRRNGFDCSEQELISFCADVVGEYKAPRRIYFMDDLPKGPSGKIQRLKLPELIT